MMSTAPPFLLNHDQAERLQGYIKTYRQYAFSALLPSVERNTMLRLLQAIQGKLIALGDQRTKISPLLLTQEEMTTLKSVVAELLLLHARQPVSSERLSIISDLVALKNSLKG